ncbi:flagellar basal body-associated FliL family protein, partial [Proteus mirabilis]|uniref:flagellar basal body-associated FliL family protein n=1 Tax=Proteus mirabilis TaxID=584 RepID=UPI001FD78EFD
AFASLMTVVHDLLLMKRQTPKRSINYCVDRVLYIGITLRLHDENTRKRLHDYLPEVRSRLLLLLSRQHANKIATDAGKQQLMTEIKETLRPTLVPGESEQILSDVLFTTFILR